MSAIVEADDAEPFGVAAVVRIQVRLQVTPTQQLALLLTNSGDWRLAEINKVGIPRILDTGRLHLE